MKRLVAWAIANSPGMNVLMIALVVVGAVSLNRMDREVFPSFDLELVTINVPYPGATPQDCEEAICQKIEEAIRSIDGIKKVTSIAQEGSGSVLAELRSDVKDVGRIVDEIDREVNRIPSFPSLAEDPVITQITTRSTAIRVGIIGPDDRTKEGERRLRDVTEEVRDEILLLPAVSSASIMGGRPFQIDVEIPEATLRSYGLSLERVAQIIRDRNVELPGGQLKGEGQEILLRAKNKGRVGEEIRKLPLVTEPNGVVLTINDLGTVQDDFQDVTAGGEINGEPAMVVTVERSRTEDLLGMVDTVKEYVAQKGLPEGYRFILWGDESVETRGRLDLLLRTGGQGLMLVFLVLTLFLEMRLAFWVALGIPVSVFGAGAALAWGDQTLNQLSLFSFMVALGIVVDDAIVIGENIYAHMQMDKSRINAAIDGTVEVMPSVTASVSTTIIAFAPLFFVSGMMGKFMAVIPLAVIAMLVVSLWESIFVLPCHLSHKHSGFFRVMSVVVYPLRPIGLLLNSISARSGRGLEWVCAKLYLPTLRFCLRYPLVPICFACAMALGTFGMLRGGIVSYNFFPSTDSNSLQATISFPDGTPPYEVDEATKRLVLALNRVNDRVGQQRSQETGIPAEEIFGSEEHPADGPIRMVYRDLGSIVSAGGPMGGDSATGSHTGQVFAELVEAEYRGIHSDKLLQMWRDESGEFIGAERVNFGGMRMGPGGRAIEFKLLARGRDVDQLLAATEAAKQRLADFVGVFDISDDNTPGKWEFQFRVKDRALATGVTPTDLGRTVRNAYFGAEAMRLQRGRHEVKLMVRYPEEERRSLVDFREIRVRTADGTERPITELAEVQLNRGFSEINRVDQMRSITIYAELDENSANAELIIRELQNKFMPKLLQEFPAVRVRWEGQREQTVESFGSLFRGFAIAMLAIFVLLVLQFRSYIQPALIMIIVPFGMIGAVWGHAWLGIPLTMFSMFGLVALSGVVINDSIVLIDFINARVREGVPLYEALIESGERRFRPILLTSMTTIAGLAPLLIEKSFQAQLLIPMAASLAFGLAVGTMLILFLVPTFYLLIDRFIDLFRIRYAEDEE